MFTSLAYEGFPPEGVEGLDGQFVCAVEFNEC